MTNPIQLPTGAVVRVAAPRPPTTIAVPTQGPPGLAQVAKAKAEIVARIDELEQAANAGQTLDFSALRGDVQALDDLNPDPVVEPEQPAE